MPEGSLLADLVLLFAAALPIVLAFQRLRIPSVAGFLVAGALIGPHGIALIGHSAEVESLADLGLVLLLFVVGLELSFRQMAALGRRALLCGILQVIVVGAAAAAGAWSAALGVPSAIAAGFILAQSSTAIVLKVLDDRGEVDAPHGRLATGILLVQDLSLVPMILFMRLLAAPAASGWQVVAGVTAKAVIAVVLIVAAARLLMPAILRRVVALRSRELFTGTIVLLCLGTAWVASRAGLSLALGALIGGLVISESEFSHQVVADILPFRDAFISVFFISVGMLTPLDFIGAHVGPVLGLTAAAVLLKFAVTAVVVFGVYRSLRVGVATACALASLGELSLVLARSALQAGVLGPDAFELLNAVAVLTMLAAPFLVHLAPRLADGVQRGLGGRVEPAPPRAERRHQVAIIGYGLNGENLAHVLRETGLSYIIVELDPERLRAAQAQREPVLYGDATRPDVLRAASVDGAHVVVVAISDPVATRRIVALVREQNPHAPVIVRTRYVAEIEDLRRLGATEVIPEEFETSVEIFARVLRRLRVPRNIITLQVDLIRRQGYGMLRGLQLPRQTLDQLDQILAATTTESFQVGRDSTAAGRSIRELQLRKLTGVTIIAVVRRGEPLTNPPPEFRIDAGDILVLVGSHAQLDLALARLGAAAPEEGEA